MGFHCDCFVFDPVLDGEGERSKVAGRILALAAISYKTHDTHNKLKK